MWHGKYAFAMTRVLITGMSGAGKSTLLTGLAARGHHVVDTDYDGWVLPSGLWDESRMEELLAGTHQIAVAGTVANQGRFYTEFDHVILLSAPLEVLLERVRLRANNPYGSAPEERAQITHYVKTVEPLIREAATSELDGTQSPASLVEAVEILLVDR